MCSWSSEAISFVPGTGLRTCRYGALLVSLSELGVCVALDEPMRDQLAEFHQLYGKPGFALKTKATTREIKEE